MVLKRKKNYKEIRCCEKGKKACEGTEEQHRLTEKPCDESMMKKSNKTLLRSFLCLSGQGRLSDEMTITWLQRNII